MTLLSNITTHTHDIRCDHGHITIPGVSTIRQPHPLEDAVAVVVPISRVVIFLEPHLGHDLASDTPAAAGDLSHPRRAL